MSSDSAQPQDTVTAGILKYTGDTTCPTMAWCFIPTYDVDVDGTLHGIQAGEVYYQNKVIEIDRAMKVGDWCFCLETNTLHMPRKWAIGIFHDKTHYTMAGISFLEINEMVVNVFMSIVVGHFGKIINQKLAQIGEEFSWEMHPVQNSLTREQTLLRVMQEFDNYYK
jgi:hypothetical protein